MDGRTLQPNIARAIQRAAEARSAIRSRRRRMAALAVCACFGVAVPLSMTLADFSGSDAVAAVSGGAQNLLAMLDQRSPGVRTEGQLTKIKKARALARMRARAPHRLAAAPPLRQPELAAILMDVPQPLPVALTAVPLAQVDLAPPPSLGGLIGSPGGSGPSIGSPGSPGAPGAPGGDTPQTIPTEQPHVPVIDTPAVPEPGTWATMLLGFAVIGWRMRRKTGSRLRPA
jgi:hypothetical protein